MEMWAHGVEKHLWKALTNIPSWAALLHEQHCASHAVQCHREPAERSARPKELEHHHLAVRDAAARLDRLLTAHLSETSYRPRQSTCQ